MFNRFLDKAFKPVVFFASALLLGTYIMNAINHMIYLALGANQSKFFVYVLESTFKLWIASGFLFACLYGLWGIVFRKK